MQETQSSNIQSSLKKAGSEVSRPFGRFSEASIWQLLETVPDPEVPVLSVLDLGIVGM